MGVVTKRSQGKYEVQAWASPWVRMIESAFAPTGLIVPIERAGEIVDMLITAGWRAPNQPPAPEVPNGC